MEEREARSVLIGIGPPVPPPQMAGLEQLKTPVNQLAPKVLLTILGASAQCNCAAQDAP